jgi:large subunit ribosomal protein L7Ae
LNQFRQTLDKTTRNELFKLLKKYTPETRKQRALRLKAAAEAKAKDSKKAVVTKAPLSIVTGVQEVTKAIEKKQAKLVVIACDVDPIELVLWMPTLCRSQKIAYAIVKDKARLGELVGRKTAAVVAVTEVNSEDAAALSAVTKSINARFAARADTLKKKWGGLQMSMRSVSRLRKRASAGTKQE